MLSPWRSSWALTGLIGAPSVRPRGQGCASHRGLVLADAAGCGWPWRHKPGIDNPPAGGSREQRLIDRPSLPGPHALDRAAQDIGLALTPAHRQHVAHEQMRMVLLHTRMGTLAATFFAVLLALHLMPNPHDGLSASQVQAWLALKLLVAAVRIGLAQAYARLGAASPAWPRWQQTMLALLLIDGAVWGLAGWFLMAESVPLAALSVAALDGVACVATFGLQVRLAATAAYVLPILLPVALGLARRGDEIAYFTSAGQLILAGLILLTARVTSRQLVVGMLLRLQSEHLVAQKDAALHLAQEQSAERTRFLAKVSHELRTPLHGMLGLARLLHLEARDATVSHRLELIESSGTHLLELINDLLDVSRINAGQFALHDKPFELTALLDQVGDVFLLRASDKGLQFELRLGLARPHWVRGDAARLRQVLNNLLGNAVKFTHRGRIVLEAVPGDQPDQVQLTVHDSGDGISDADQRRIFAPFQQAGADRPTDGVGLGLTIAREIAIAMGGDISLRSGAGQGSSFRFVARLPSMAAPLASAPAWAQRPGLPQLVLVAEDDEVNALIVCDFLQGLGVRCEHVADGKQAVSRALRETDRPELVLMDCRMPVMDGLQASAEIRRQERILGLPRLPIVALTATTTDADHQACALAGMDRVVGKPFSLAQLDQALRDAGPPWPPPPADSADRR